jgi:hypothetical protein
MKKMLAVLASAAPMATTSAGTAQRTVDITGQGDWMSTFERFQKGVVAGCEHLAKASRARRRACLALAALGTSGCALPAVNLSPREVSADEAAIFGRIEVVNDGERVTERCKVVFTDEDKRDKTPRMKLDESGWVFATVRPGPTYLSSVLCGIPNTQYYSGDYLTRRLAFQAPGHGRAAYFGHVRIDVHAIAVDRGAMFLAGMARGLTPGSEYFPPQSAAGVTQSVPEKARPEKRRDDRAWEASLRGDGDYGSEVQNRFGEAVDEYRRLYGGDAQALKPEISIVGESPGAVGVLAEAAYPTAALGFALGQAPEAAEARCTGAGLAWQKVDGGGFSCGGAVVDLGVPVTLKLTACAGMICEVVADAGADGAAWSTLLKRFGKLTGRLAREHGAKHQRETRALAGCTLGTKDCASAGRVLKSETWRWPDKQRVSVELDGGPPDGAPSLRVLYRTSAFFEAMP